MISVKGVCPGGPGLLSERSKAGLLMLSLLLSRASDLASDLSGFCMSPENRRVLGTSPPNFQLMARECLFQGRLGSAWE